MHLALTEQLQKLIQRRMESGQYATPEDVMAAALYSLERDESREQFDPGELDRLMAEGESSGEPLDGEQVLDELRDLRTRHAGKDR